VRQAGANEPRGAFISIGGLSRLTGSDPAVIVPVQPTKYAS